MAANPKRDQAPPLNSDPGWFEGANRAVYDSAKAVNAFTRADSLQPAERVIFGNICEELRGKRILDIGVSGGRATLYLRNLTSHYTGIDYSAAMVETARRKTGVSSIYQCDAQDMRC